MIGVFFEEDTTSAMSIIMSLMIRTNLFNVIDIRLVAAMFFHHSIIITLAEHMF